MSFERSFWMKMKTKMHLWTYFKKPWNPLKTPMNHPWNFLETLFKPSRSTLKLSSNTLETSSKHIWNFDITFQLFQILLKLNENFLKTPLKFFWYTLETFLNHSLKFLETSWKLPWNTLVTPLKLPCWTSFKYPWPRYEG